MKKRMVSFVVLIVLGSISYGQKTTDHKVDSGRYTSAMIQNIALLDTANSIGTLSILANNFERVALAETTDWLSFYYAANCNISLASKSDSKDAMDMFSDKAEAQLKSADSLSKNNSEIYCLYYLLSYTRIKADPMGRFQQYSIMASDYIKMAKKLNPENPRAYLCEAQVILHTPEAFGGGKAEAKSQIEETVKKFNVFIPETNLSPNWGKKTAQQLLEQVSKSN